MNENVLKITNMLRADAEHVSETGLPLDAFPNAVQDIILKLASYENFNIEYTASVILSAVATAIGNSCQIRIKGEWKQSPALYMMLIGRPGAGKTPPLKFIYAPIREHDEMLYDKFCDQLDEYEESEAKKGKGSDTLSNKKPQLITTIVSDFTPEAMINIHHNNLRGIVVMVDEILAMFNSVKRYNNKNNLIEDLLSAYSGQSIKVVRKSECRPILIKKPCINLIGSIQTKLLSEVFCKEYDANGLLDRFLFVYPENKKISSWIRIENDMPRPDILADWRNIIYKVLSIPCLTNDRGNEVCPVVLELAPDAEEYFFNWNNGIIESVNAIEDDEDVESRKIKLNGNAARIALVFQVLKWATGESHMRFIEKESVVNAIRMIEYYENTYHRIQDVIVTNNVSNITEDWLSLLGNKFTSGDAVEAGKKVGMSRRSVFYALDNLCKLSNPPIMKVERGHYQKNANEYKDALCTIALTTEQEGGKDYD